MILTDIIYTHGMFKVVQSQLTINMFS